MKFVVVVLLACALVAYFVSFRIATASHDPEVWHIDPLTVETSETPNSFRMAPAGSTTERVDAVSPIFSEDPLILAEAFDEFALNQRATIRIAGLPAELMVTYVQRTERLKLPDYITVKFFDYGDGTTSVAIYSRSRYGYADLGVNQARVERWIKTLESFEVEPGN